MPAAGVYSVTAATLRSMLNAAQAVAFENAHIILNVPQNDTITVVDSAANLEALTTEEFGAGTDRRRPHRRQRHSAGI